MFEYLSENGTDVIAIMVAAMAALKIIVRLTPSLKDDAIFGKLDKVLEFLIPNYDGSEKR
jgi:hypothetical protein